MKIAYIPTTDRDRQRLEILLECGGVTRVELVEGEQAYVFPKRMLGATTQNGDQEYDRSGDMWCDIDTHYQIGNRMIRRPVSMLSIKSIIS